MILVFAFCLPGVSVADFVAVSIFVVASAVASVALFLFMSVFVLMPMFAKLPEVLSVDWFCSIGVASLGSSEVF